MTAMDRPLRHPDRELIGFRPFKALRHFRKLLADKDDTEQVFHIIESLKGPKGARQAADFVQSPDGRRLLAENADLPAMLDDRKRWSDCGPDSVAQAYFAFMDEAGFTARGLVEESHKWLPPEQRQIDLYEWYFDRLRDTHDLFHVLTGYGRDPLGELALLGFSYAQNHNHGVQFIAYAGARQMKKDSSSAAPLKEAVREGQRLGAAARKLAHEDIADLMREPLDSARKRLGIGAPIKYQECLRIFRSEGIAIHDPSGKRLGEGQCCAA